MQGTQEARSQVIDTPYAQEISSVKSDASLSDGYIHNLLHAILTKRLSCIGKNLLLAGKIRQSPQHKVWPNLLDVLPLPFAQPDRQ